MAPRHQAWPPATPAVPWLLTRRLVSRTAVVATEFWGGSVHGRGAAGLRTSLGREGVERRGKEGPGRVGVPLGALSTRHPLGRPGGPRTKLGSGVTTVIGDRQGCLVHLPRGQGHREPRGRPISRKRGPPPRKKTKQNPQDLSRCEDPKSRYAGVLMFSCCGLFPPKNHRTSPGSTV